MAHLKSPEQIAKAIGAVSNGTLPSATDEKFLAMLDAVHPRLEEALNIPTLVLSDYTDTFEVAKRFPSTIEVFRLTGGFLTNDEVTVTDANGDTIDASRLLINRAMGTIGIERVATGRYTVTYRAGFAVQDGTTELYDVPDEHKWLGECLIAHALIWFRTMQSQIKAPEGISFNAIMTPLYRDLQSRIYMRYQRPRAGMHWPLHAERTPVTA